MRALPKDRHLIFLGFEDPLPLGFRHRATSDLQTSAVATSSVNYLNVHYGGGEV